MRFAPGSFPQSGPARVREGRSVAGDDDDEVVEGRLAVLTSRWNPILPPKVTCWTPFEVVPISGLRTTFTGCRVDLSAGRSDRHEDVTRATPAAMSAPSDSSLSHHPPGFAGRPGPRLQSIFFPSSPASTGPEAGLYPKPIRPFWSALPVATKPEYLLPENEVTQMWVVALNGEALHIGMSTPSWYRPVG